MQSLSFRHPPPTEPGYHFTEEAARSIIGQQFKIRIGENDVEAKATACELINDTGELWMTVDVPDDTEWITTLIPPA